MHSRTTNRRPARRAAAIASPIAVLTVLAACAAGGSDGTADAEPRPVTARITSDITTFNPALARTGDEYPIDRLLYDTVLRRDGDELVGGLATDWTAESASEYVFTIRHDATCADGTAITADVIADSLAYLAAPETGSPWKSLAFGPGAVTVTAEDTTTVRVSLTEPFSDVPMGLTVAQAGIICPAGLADIDGLAAGTVSGAVSGPYALGDVRPGIGYTFELREDYDVWPVYAEPLTGVPAPVIDVAVAGDESTVANQILSGDLDVAAGLDPATAARFSDQDFGLTEYTSGSSYLVFNERPGRVFADNPEARQAVARAFDREAFNVAFSDGTAPLLLSVVGSDFAFVNEDESLLEEYDPDAAAETLDGVAITFVASNSFGNGGAGAEFIYESLRSAGSAVDFQLVDTAGWATTISTPGSDWDMTIIGDINAIGLINASLNRVVGPALEDGGRSFGGSDNAEAAEVLARALAVTDTDERAAAYQTVQRSMFEQDNFVPLAGVVNTLVTAADVSARIVGGMPDFSSIRIIG